MKRKNSEICEVTVSSSFKVDSCEPFVALPVVQASF